MFGEFFVVPADELEHCDEEGSDDYDEPNFFFPFSDNEGAHDGECHDGSECGDAKLEEVFAEGSGSVDLGVVGVVVFEFASGFNDPPSFEEEFKHSGLAEGEGDKDSECVEGDE